MTLTWGGLAEAPASIPTGAVTDLSQVEVVDYHRHVLSPPDAGGIALVRDTLTEQFADGLDGEGHAEHLRVVAADSSSTFVGIERFIGRVAGRRGSFALTAHGITTSEGLVRGVWRVVAGSATGELRRLRGRGAFTACRHTDGVWRSEDRSTHWYEPEEPAAATTAAAARPPTAVR
jgi:Protein of unknown function (DUF3224)